MQRGAVGDVEIVLRYIDFYLKFGFRCTIKKSVKYFRKTPKFSPGSQMIIR